MKTGDTSYGIYFRHSYKIYVHHFSPCNSHTHTHIYIYNYGDSHFHHKITIYKYIFIMYIYIYFTIFHHLSHWSWLISSPQKARHFGLRSWCIAMSRKPWAMSAASALLWSWCRGSWGVFFFFVGYIYKQLNIYIIHAIQSIYIYMYIGNCRVYIYTNNKNPRQNPWWLVIEWGFSHYLKGFNYGQ